MQNNFLASILGAALILSFVSFLNPLYGAIWTVALCLIALGIGMSKKRSIRESLRGLDDLLFIGEQAVVAVALLVMAFAVFLDVVWRTVHSVSGSSATSMMFGIFVLCIIGGFTARWPGASPVKRGIAGVAAFVILTGLGWLIAQAENGFGWSQRLALVLILWVGMLGGSMATKEGRHIAVDAVKRVVPDHLKRPMEAVAGIFIVGFCAFITVLGIVYVQENYHDWSTSGYRSSIFESLPIPYWAATLPIPIGFGLMATRFLAVTIYGAKEVDLLTSVGAADMQTESSETVEANS